MQADTLVPPGAVSYVGDQFSANTGTLDYESVVFQVSSLLGVFGRHADDLGYSLQLHNLLLQAQHELKEAGGRKETACDRVSVSMASSSSHASGSQSVRQSGKQSVSQPVSQFVC